MLKALAINVDKACLKLRKEGLYVNCVSVFFSTHKLKPNRKYFYAFNSLENSTNSEIVVYKMVEKMVEKLFIEGYSLKKSGVALTHLSKDKKESLFCTSRIDFERVSSTADRLRRIYGEDHLIMAPAHVQNASWKPLNTMRSQRYTTKWEELLRVY